MNTAQDAHDAIELYARLAAIDANIKAMNAPPGCATTSLQRVTFYQWTPCVSGPCDYVPKHNAKAIERAIIKDMNAERDAIVCELHNMGFGI